MGKERRLLVKRLQVRVYGEARHDLGVEVVEELGETGEETHSIFCG